MNESSLPPEEILLLEHYTSIEYFGELRAVWGKLISHLEMCLTNFMGNLPADYRSRPLPEQADIVWGERVLPNFRETFQGLCSGYIKLSHGDASGLHFAHGPLSDFKGQSDFWADWMSPPDQNTYGDLLNTAVSMASNICASEGAYWNPVDLRANADEIGNLQIPKIWNSYRIKSNVSVISGAKTSQDGVYVPDVEQSCPQFLSKKYAQAPEAIVLVRMDALLSPASGEKYGEQPVYRKEPCTWYLVERTPGGMEIASMPSLIGKETHRLLAGDSCREAGYYFTPSRKDSRRKFEKDEIMPDFNTGYGATIWQWDSNQS